MKRVFPGILICFLLTQYISAQPFFPENGPLYNDTTTNLEDNDYTDLAAFIDVLENSPDERLLCDLDALFNTYDYLNNEKINCTIYNSRGIVVFKGKEVDEIDLNNYPSGLYIIATDDGRRVKFIVARPD